MIEALSSAKLPAPRFRYSPLVKAGPFYQTAGMIALNADTGELEPGGAGAETARILANLRAALPDFGLSLADLVQVNVYTTDFASFPDINAAWEAVFTADVRPPARTALGVTSLPLGAAVEMDFQLYRPD
ncbi:MAG: RidA family protein [Gammaproteobacteria bacterium]